MSSPSRPESSTPDLQFDRAIPATGTDATSAMTCPRCQGAITTHYYHVDGAPACPGCKQIAEQALATRRSPGAMARAALFGLGASIVGAIIYYGVMAILDLEIGIVAILTGYLVGKAVRRGAGGAGGRRYQIMAVGLTYFSVAMAYLPFAIKGLAEHDTVGAVATTPARSDSARAPATDSARASAPAAASSADSAVAPSTPARATKSKTTTEKPSGLAIAGALAFALGMTLALPLVVAFGSMPGGLLSILIIGFGLRQAWRLTAENSAKITGPYKVGAASATAG